MIEIFTLILQCYVFEAILEERKIYEKNRRRRPKEFREWNYDSLKISNGKWMWWSQRTGGRSALDYLIKVRGYSFLEAVELLAERANIQPPLFVSENVPMEKQLLLPKKNQDDQKVIAIFCYLSIRIGGKTNFKMVR